MLWFGNVVSNTTLVEPSLFSDLRKLRALFFVIAAALTGCATTNTEPAFEQPGQTDLLVDTIEIRGAEAFDAGTIKDGLATREDPGWRKKAQWLPLIGAEASYYNPVIWEKDKERIRTFYKARGYFDVEITSINVQENRSGTAVRIMVTIDEGKPTTIKSVTIDGLKGTGLEASDLLDDIPVSIGQTFVEQTYLRSKDELVNALEQRSYAYANLRGRVVVSRDKSSADVFFFVDPGPACTFGELKIEGLEDVKEEYVREAVAFETDEPYDPEEVRDTQAAIYDLGVFSVVKVAPEHQLLNREVYAEGEGARKPTEAATVAGIDSILNQAQEQAEKRVKLDSVVPVIIRLKEAKTLNIRVGAGAAFESQRAAVRGRADWTNRNFLGGLRKLEHFNTAGYAWADTESTLLPNFSDPSNEGVTLGSELRFTQPQFIERLTSFNSRVEIRRDVEPYWTVLSPSLTVGLRRTWFRRLRTDISYNAALYRISNLGNAPPVGRPPSEYLIEYLEQRLLLDFRNDALNPTRGWAIELVLQEATSLVGQTPGISGGDFDYIYASLGAENYLKWTLGVPQVLATRVRLGSIYNIGREALPPLPQRLYAGGPDSIRSFGTDRLSLYTTDGGESFAIGGFTRAEAAIEPRFRLVEKLLDIGDLWGAVYLDAATILPGQFLIDTGPNGATCAFDDGCVEDFDSITSSLLYGVGSGVWWLTPVGPVRFDVAYTLSDTTQDPRLRQCPVPTDDRGYCPSDAFRPTSEDKVQDSISRWNVYIGIGHTF